MTGSFPSINTGIALDDIWWESVVFVGVHLPILTILAI